MQVVSLIGDVKIKEGKVDRVGNAPSQLFALDNYHVDGLDSLGQAVGCGGGGRRLVLVVVMRRRRRQFAHSLSAAARHGIQRLGHLLRIYHFASEH